MSELENYFLNSFLKEILLIPNLTDISYNGLNLYYETTTLGREKSSLQIDCHEVFHFLKQLGNLSSKLFSFQNPILDISIKNYRINAVHPLIGRVGDNSTATFTIRVLNTKLITPDDKKVTAILADLVKQGQSIIIFGKSGTGKTELQKYLISLIEAKNKVYIIDNIRELSSVHSHSKCEIIFWEINNDFKVSIAQLTKNALRSNPDWLIVAEARNEEIIPVISSALSGHPLIITIHAQSREELLMRLTNIYLEQFPKTKIVELRKTLESIFPYYIHLSKTITKHGIKRSIESIIFSTSKERKILYCKKEIKC